MDAYIQEEIAKIEKAFNSLINIQIDAINEALGCNGKSNMVTYTATKYIDNASANPNIQDKVNHLFDRLDKLNSVITNLGARLQPIMKPDTVTEGTSTAKCEEIRETQSSIALQLENAIDVINGNITRLVIFTERLEV